MPGQRLGLLALSEIKQPDAAVAGKGEGDRLAIGIQGDTNDGSGQVGELFQLFGIGGVPYGQGLVRASGGNLSAVGAKRHALNGERITAERALGLAVGNIPHAGLLVYTTR